MKWTLILRLSLIELALAVGSIFFISPNFETLLWLILVLYYAYSIGKNTRQLRFLHGLLLGILNGVWAAVTHDVFLTRYLTLHPVAVETIAKAQSANAVLSPRAILSVTAVVLGLLGGIVVGVFAIVAGMMVKPKRIDLTQPDMSGPGTQA